MPRKCLDVSLRLVRLTPNPSVSGSQREAQRDEGGPATDAARGQAAGIWRKETFQQKRIVHESRETAVRKRIQGHKRLGPVQRFVLSWRAFEARLVLANLVKDSIVSETTDIAENINLSADEYEHMARNTSGICLPVKSLNSSPGMRKLKQ